LNWCRNVAGKISLVKINRLNFYQKFIIPPPATVVLWEDFDPPELAARGSVGGPVGRPQLPEKTHHRGSY
jgi:hypothetical protein